MKPGNYANRNDIQELQTETSYLRNEVNVLKAQKNNGNDGNFRRKDRFNFQ